MRKGSGSLQVKIAGEGRRASISPVGAVSLSWVGFFLNKLFVVSLSSTYQTARGNYAPTFPRIASQSDCKLERSPGVNFVRRFWRSRWLDW